MIITTWSIFSSSGRIARAASAPAGRSASPAMIEPTVMRVAELSHLTPVFRLDELAAAERR